MMLPDPSKNMRFTKLGEQLSSGSGIETLMEDLGQALSGKDPAPLMLGGGNPAHIPEIEAIWKRKLETITNSPEQLRRALSIYDPPRGNASTLEALANLINTHFGWNITPENIAVTPGGQTAFFLLFNLLAGTQSDGSKGRILFPSIPEYIGYANQVAEPNSFTTLRPNISHTNPHRFRYSIDLSAVTETKDLSAICLSRPTNPSGNVVDDTTLQHLAELAQQRGIPLLIDHAYGKPFPNIMFCDATSPWNESTVHVLSLSKLGLPATRTAFIIGPPKITKAIQSMMAVAGLANTNIGQSLVTDLIQDHSIIDTCKNVITPFYKAKRDHALAAAHHHFEDHLPYAFHETDGALFLWLWLKDCPLPTHELYLRLKEKGVLVVPGEPFFFGPAAEGWKHARECIRISFAMENATVERGLAIIGNELSDLYNPFKK
jgi:valine--pyruvate aminotransferase